MLISELAMISTCDGGELISKKVEPRWDAGGLWSCALDKLGGYATARGIDVLRTRMKV